MKNVWKSHSTNKNRAEAGFNTCKLSAIEWDREWALHNQRMFTLKIAWNHQLLIQIERILFLYKISTLKKNLRKMIHKWIKWIFKKSFFEVSNSLLGGQI